MDLLYFHSAQDIITTLNEFKKDNVTFIHALSSSIDTIIDELGEIIPPSLYSKYSANLRKAIDIVFSDDTHNDLSNKFRLNVSRFAAYKAHEIADIIRNNTDGDKKLIQAILKTANRHQAAEYNTARSRARTAKQWKEFDENKDIFPNLKWLPSRSVAQREEHQPFYNRVWAKDDPFWSTNQPGTLWNCKCDWQETDEPVTSGNPKTKIVALGLEGNPAKTEEIFTDKSAYIRRASKRAKADVESFFKPIEQHFKDYIKYSQDSNYKDVKFNWDNGGMLAIHKDHNFDDLGGEFEKKIGEAFYANGDSIIFGSEKGKPKGKSYSEGLLNNKSFEVKGVTTDNDNNYLRVFKHASDKQSKIAVGFLPDGVEFDKGKAKKAVNRYAGLVYQSPDNFFKVQSIVFIVDNKIVYRKHVTYIK